MGKQFDQPVQQPLGHGFGAESDDLERGHLKMFVDFGNQHQIQEGRRCGEDINLVSFDQSPHMNGIPRLRDRNRRPCSYGAKKRVYPPDVIECQEDENVQVLLFFPPVGIHEKIQIV